MKKIAMIILPAMILTAVFSTGALSQQKANKSEKDDDDWTYRNGNHNIPGTWTAMTKKERAYIQFNGENWSTGRRFSLSELGALPIGKDGQFSLAREAGLMTFSGIFNDNRGYGTYKFTANPSFTDYLSQQGFNIDNELMLHIFFTNINKNYIEYLKANGYGKISNSQLRDLAHQDINYGVLQDYFNLFKKENYTNVSLDKIIELREHGVDAGFIEEFHEIGFSNFSLDRALSLRDHGVDADFVAGFQKAGYKDISLERAQNLRDHGVDLDYIHSIQQMGYKTTSLEKIQELRDHGVDPDYIKEFHEIGYKDISLERARDLRDHGVDADFIGSIQRLGYKDISLDRAQSLRDHGVDADFIKDFNEIGFTAIPLEKVQELRDHGLSAGYIKKMRQRGYNNLSLSEYMKLKDSGI